MKKFSLIKSLMLVCLWCIGMGAWAEEYSFTIQASDFNTTSYAANNGSHDFTATCTTDDNKTMTIACTSNQVYQNSSKMQWQKSNAYIYNTTDLGTIKSVTVNSSGGTFTTYYGTTEHPTSGTTVGNGYFTVKVGSATGYTSSIVVVFEVTSGGSTPTVTAPAFDVAAGTYTEDQLVIVDNYNSDNLYAYTLDGSDPAFDSNLDVTNGTLYNKDKGIEITSSCTLKVIAVNGEGNASSITSAAYVINKPFASLEALVAADLATGTNVTVSFENVPIKSFQTVSGTRKGVYFDIQKAGKDIEIYFNSAVPAEWVEGGTLSGTMTDCPWKLYSSTWELAPATGWAWTNLTYNAPAQKTITALAVSGTPTKTTYNVGDAFETAGLVVTATYSDETQAPISTGFDWEIDYGTGNTALVAGATSVDVMVYTDEEMSEVYTVTGLTVNVPITLTSIAVSGTPTKTEYYAGDAFETAGLVVTGHYSDGSDKPITEGIEWTIDPENLALGTSSIDVIAGVGSVVSEVYTVNGLTVAENPYKTATISTFSTASGEIDANITYESFKGNATTAPAVYNDAIRLYQNGAYVTITAATGLKINSVKITTSATYASTAVGYCVDDEDAPTTGKTVAKSTSYTISDLDNQSVSIYCLGKESKYRLEIASITVEYSRPRAVIAVNPSAKYGTFCAPFNVNVPAGVTASTATLDGQTIVLAEVDGNAIPANTPVVLYAEEGLAPTTVYGDYVVAGTPVAGVLTGVYEETQAPNGSYVLQLQSGKVGFYQVDTEVVTPSVGANRAYLTAPSSSNARAFFFDAETAISTIESLTSGKAEIYNLNGVKLNGLQKGINIVNGKKVMVK